MKDAELRQPLHARLQSVAIEGWLDEDGDQVTSAVAVADEPPAEQPKPDRIERHRRRWADAWLASGHETDTDGRPYLTRSAMLAYLVSPAVGLTEASATNECKPSHNNRCIGALLEARALVATPAGWAVTDQVWASAMILGGQC
jgi:putative DNA primase/helicase